MKEDDFVEPHPNFSRNGKLIRAISFLVALGVSLACMKEICRYLAAYAGGRVPILYVWPFYLGVQLLFMIPCWRAWCMKRWACWTVFYLLLLVNVWMLVAASVLWPFRWGLVVTATAWLILFAAVEQEDERLKSGF